MIFAWRWINLNAVDNAGQPPPPPLSRGFVLGKIERIELASAIEMSGRSAIASFAGLSAARYFTVGRSLFASGRIVILETG